MKKVVPDRITRLSLCVFRNLRGSNIEYANFGFTESEVLVARIRLAVFRQTDASAMISTAFPLKMNDTIVSTSINSRKTSLVLPELCLKSDLFDQNVKVRGIQIKAL